jgi:ubiquinone/menaquinone biosynthesis C-methylase UbiE
MKEEITFEKYQKQGAYHWEIYFGNIFKIDSFLRGRYGVVTYLLQRAGIGQSSSLLEVGCGDGALSGLIFKKFGCELTGIEPSSDGIRFCREMFNKYRFKGTFEISEGYSFNFPDNHYDIVVLADVIEHLQHPDLMLAEIKRIVKPGGHVVITTPVRTSEHPEDKMHVREFYPDELNSLCKTYFGDAREKVYSHPLVWYELYSFGKKFNRSIIRLYCRITDKIMNRNVFFKAGRKSRWINFKQQGLLLRKPL